MEPALKLPAHGSPFGGLLKAIQARIDDDQSVASNAEPHKRFKKFADMTPLQTHDIVTEGLPVVLAREMMAEYEVVGREDVLQAIGVSERTLQRGKDNERLLDSNASDRLLRLAAVTEHAIDVFGSKDAAERWLVTPALALDQRKPIDLLQSSEGAELVKSLLIRIDYGVYS
jgi:putative toxin-antitoxin system antitoxin component (TIGR02293 family)